MCLAPHSGPAYYIFNANQWQDKSKGLIQSCATEYSLLLYAAARITDVCSNSRDACRWHFQTLTEQLRHAPFDFSRVVVFAQVPEMHMSVEAFFSGLKSLLDLLAQLLSTEQVVSVKVNGFHRDGDCPGGRVIKCLQRNVRADKKDTARKVIDLIRCHKALWIDGAIAARDLLIHPARGAQQLMFQLDLNYGAEAPDWSTLPPHVGDEAIDTYCGRRIEHAREFSTAFLAILRE